MTEGIIIAIIGAAGAVLAAVITGIFSASKRGEKSIRTTTIRQRQKGKNNTQIGIQNNFAGAVRRAESSEERETEE